MNYYAPIGVLDNLANALEDGMAKIPVLRLFTYQVLGDPASWIFSHPFFVGIGASIGAILGSVIGFFTIGIERGTRLGTVIGAWFVVAIYIVREIVDAKRKRAAVGPGGAWRRLPVEKHRGIHVGWFFDGIGDIIGAIIAALTIQEKVWI